MSATGAKCQYCGALCSLNESLLRHLGVYDWGNCGNCGLFLKMTLDKTQKNIVATEKCTSVINFGMIRSYLLRKDLPYSEPPISENVCQELKQIMIGIKINTDPDPTNPKGRAFKNEDSKKWVINNLMPKIVPIYSDYGTLHFIDDVENFLSQHS
jgi:hypothetical protein